MCQIINNDNVHDNIHDNIHDINLSKFSAQLVKNNEPFAFNQSLIQKYKHAQHKLRIITYNYGYKYVDNYLVPDTGIFIEKHEFIQAITPMNSECSGFVILGHITNNFLELIAVSIPFGYTLLLEPWAIHGDSTLRGMYMMAMTGNHSAMQTADTVFLKNKITRKNIVIYSNESSNKFSNESSNKYPNSNIINKMDDILLTSDKMSLEKLKKCDKILKQTINTTINKINPIMNLLWQPVIVSGTYLFGWAKTLGCYLP